MRAYTRICLSLLCITSYLIAEEVETPSYTTLTNEVQYPLLTPTLEKRKTAKIILKNGLKAYLVSDPDIQQSAASMTVEVGSWQDPEEYPGMAHFLEHMLFMGNKAYPDEAEYSQYILDNGGLNNAFTAPDRTVYMLSINNNAYAGALDRFSHFFIDPLFNPSCIERELLAVDQENSKNLENDAWREYMVLKETGNPKHPHQKFSTGNAQTLSGIPQEALQKWYEKHYSANKMHLIMLSAEPLETMIEQANTYFSSIPSKDIDTDPSLEEPILSEKQKGHILYIKPVKDLKTLSLVWQLPQEFSSLEEKWTVEMIAYAIEHASEDSLIKQLKREGLAESLSAANDPLGQNTSFFQISIQLTQKGLSQIDIIILRCFQALARLQQTGLSLSLFQEMQTIKQIDYQYESRQDPFSWLYKMAYDIANEPLATFPENTNVPSSFNPQSCLHLLKALTPESCAYIVMANHEGPDTGTFIKEKWFGVEYAIQPLLPSKLLAWQQAAPHPQIQPPELNPFALTSVPAALASPGESKQTIFPKVLLRTDRCKVYFAQDEIYLVPEVSFSFRLKTPFLDGSARSYVFMDILCKGLKDKLSTALFFANKGGLSTGFGCKNMQFIVQITGYSEKAPSLAKELFSKIKHLQISSEEFDTYKASLLRLYANDACELPIKQAAQILSGTLLNDAPISEEKWQALQDFSWKDWNAISQEWLSEVYLQALLYGHITEEEASVLAKDLQEGLSDFKPYLAQKERKQKIRILPSSDGPFKIVHKTERQGFATLLAIQEGAFSFMKKASQQVLSQALHEAFFDTLRTKQQTGYIAESRPSEIDKQLMHTFAVQSSSHASEDLLSRFEIFLADFTKEVRKIIPEERFLLLKKAQIVSLSKLPENLATMGERLDILAFEYEADFDRIAKRIDALEALSYEDFITDVQTFLSKENMQRLAILVKGQSSGSKPLHYQEVSQADLKLKSDSSKEDTL